MPNVFSNQATLILEFSLNTTDKKCLLCHANKLRSYKKAHKDSQKSRNYQIYLNKSSKKIKIFNEYYQFLLIKAFYGVFFSVISRRGTLIYLIFNAIGNMQRKGIECV